MPIVVRLGEDKLNVLLQSGQQRNGSYNNPQQLTLTAISLKDREKAWETRIDSVSRREFRISASAANAPREISVEPLGPGGAPAIVAGVTHMGPQYEQYGSTGRSRGRLDMTAIDSATGKGWEKSLCRFGYNIPPIRWLVGDDLDGDGHREIFAAWVADFNLQRPEVTVAALSGSDGHFLWRWTTDGVSGNDETPPPLRWWQPGTSGRPQLVVPVNRTLGGQPATYILDSASGRLTHTLTGVADPRTCDLNGDGLADLLYSVAPQGFARLMAVRGEPPMATRWLDGRERRIAQDFDGDGLDDLLIDDWGGPVNLERAISGRDGKLLWQAIRQMGNSSRPVSTPLPLGDLAGDGHPALLALTQKEFDPADPNSSYLVTPAAFSGRDGHRLWPLKGSKDQMLIQNGQSSGGADGRHFTYPALGLAQLDPRKPADVLVSVPDSMDRTHPRGAGPYGLLVWLNVVSGDSGKLRWQAPFANAQFGENGHVYESEFRDLNGDGVADIVGWTIPPKAPPGVALELTAYSGVDGTPLWKSSPPSVGPNGNMPLPIVGDLDGQGAPDVLFVRHPQWDKGELLAVSGRDGHVKWNWAWNGGQSSTTSAPIVVDFGGKGRRCVALLTTDIIKTENSTTYQPRLVVLDGAGKVVKRIDFKGSGPIGSQFNGNRTWWRSIDLGGGPKQALLFFDEGALQSLAGESIEPVWKWPLAADDATIVDVLPAGKQFPATIAIWSGKSVYGLSCDTGRPRWRGEMPGSGPNVINGEIERVVLRDANGPGLPQLVWGDGCRFTWPTDDNGRYAPPRGEPMTYAPVADPVSLRALPWAEMKAVPVVLKMIPWAFLWLVVPALLIRWAMRRNSWRLAFIPAFYQLAVTLSLNLIPLHWLPFNSKDWVKWDPHVGVCALSGLFLVMHAVWMLRRRLWMLVDASAIYAIAIALGLSQQIEHRDGESVVFIMHASVPDTLAYLAATAGFGVPTIAAMVWIVNWLRRGQWLRLGLFIIGSIVCSIGLAASMILTNQWANHFEETYSWDGWWLVLVYGVYGAASLSIVGWLGKRAFLWCRRTLSRIVAGLGRKKAA